MKIYIFLFFTAVLCIGGASAEAPKHYQVEGRVFNVDAPNSPIEDPFVSIRIVDKNGYHHEESANVLSYAGQDVATRYLFAENLKTRNYWDSTGTIYATAAGLRQINLNNARLHFKRKFTITKDIEMRTLHKIAEVEYEKGRIILNSFKDNNNIESAIEHIDNALTYRPNLERAIIARATAIERHSNETGKLSEINSDFIYSYFSNNDSKLKEVFGDNYINNAMNIHKHFAHSYKRTINNITHPTKAINLMDFHIERFFSYAENHQNKDEIIDIFINMTQLKYKYDIETGNLISADLTLRNFFLEFPEYKNGRVIRAFLADWLTVMELMFGRIDPSNDALPTLNNNTTTLKMWEHYYNSLENNHHQFRWGDSTKSKNLRRAFETAKMIVGK